MGVTKVTIIDSPEKIRARNMGYSIIIPQLKDPLPCKDHNQDEIQTKSGSNQKA